ncbi:MAG TPA: hypothetical protein VF653_10580 [Methylomirabilota bacterium]
MKRRKPRRADVKTPTHMKVRKPMPAKPPKVEVPKTVYRRRAKHPRPPGAGQ